MRERETRAHCLPEASGVNTGKILLLLVTIVAGAYSSRNPSTMSDNVILVLVVNELLVIVRHVGLWSKRERVEGSRDRWQVVAEGRKEA